MSEHETISRKERNPQRTKLTSQQRQGLLALVSGPGYSVVLELMRMECVLQDAALSAVDPADEKRVCAEHRISVAKWDFFHAIQTQIEHEVKEMTAVHDGPVMTAEEKEIAAILDPTAPQN